MGAVGCLLGPRLSKQDAVDGAASDPFLNNSPRLCCDCSRLVVLDIASERTTERMLLS
jgi:hypothetical protein